MHCQIVGKIGSKWQSIAVKADPGHWICKVGKFGIGVAQSSNNIQSSHGSCPSFQFKASNASASIGNSIGGKGGGVEENDLIVIYWAIKRRQIDG